MTASQVKKTAQHPAAADIALTNSTSSMSIVDAAVGDCEFSEHPNPQLKIALVLRSRVVDASWVSVTGRVMRSAVRPGTASVMPAEMPYKTHWRGGGRMVLLSFSDSFLDASSQAEVSSCVDLQPAWAQSDPFLMQLGLSVLAAQQVRLSSRAYLDAAAEVAMVHLQTRYGNIKPTAPVDLGSLRLSRVVDLIEAHLDEDLPLARMAGEAGLSVYGFARSFRHAMGVAPHQYLLQRRCERAKQLLRNSFMPLVDIAAALGFSSQAHLTTTFLKATGTTPARYRASSGKQV